MQIEELLTKKVVSNVPLDVFSAFQHILKDPAKIEKAWATGNDPNLFKLSLYSSNGPFYAILAHPSYVIGSGGIGIYIDNDTIIRMPLNNNNFAKLESSYILVEVTKAEGIEITEKIRAKGDVLNAYATYDTTKEERGKMIDEIIQENGINRIDAFYRFMGYGEDNPYLKELLFVRLIPFFTVPSKPMPLVFEFSQPDTGKTSFAKKMMSSTSTGYTNNMTSPAALVYNTKLGMPGMVYKYDTIIFDETDKIYFGSQDGMEVLNILLTGISHGIWTRAKGNAPQHVKDVSFLFMGNVDDRINYATTGSEYVRALFESKKLKVDIKPLIDRITASMVTAQDVKASQYVSDAELNGDDLRAWLYVLRQQFLKEYKSYDMMDGRKRMAFDHVMAAYKVLYGEEDEGKVLQYVEGKVVV